MNKLENLDTSRRSLFKGGAALAATVPFVGALHAFSLRQADATVPIMPAAGPYGPVSPVKDKSTGLELLQLPEGFSYKSFSWAGDLMVDGQPVPRAHREPTREKVTISNRNKRSSVLKPLRIMANEDSNHALLEKR